MADVLEREGGFCSGGDDDDIEAEDGIHSPTDASEDSVDVKVQVISFRNRNKRKCAEPRKLDSELPAKKRKLKSDDDSTGRKSPFRPWSTSPTIRRKTEPRIYLGLVPSGISMASLASSQFLPSNFQTSVQRLPPETLTTTPSSPIHQEEPLSLVSKRKTDYHTEVMRNSINGPVGEVEIDSRTRMASPAWYPPSKSASAQVSTPEERTNDRESYLVNKVKLIRSANSGKTNLGEKCKQKFRAEDVSNGANKFRIDCLLSSARTETNSAAPTTSKSSQQGGQQRNYKNMTRERRIEANARERTRVHTISAAFDTLRHAIPAYSHNQKLSKLSILRIACSYIMTLSRLAGHDYSKDQNKPDLSTCVDNVSKTIHTEGKVRKKKED